MWHLCCSCRTYPVVEPEAAGNTPADIEVDPRHGLDTDTGSSEVGVHRSLQQEVLVPAVQDADPVANTVGIAHQRLACVQGTEGGSTADPGPAGS